MSLFKQIIAFIFFVLFNFHTPCLSQRAIGRIDKIIDVSSPEPEAIDSTDRVQIRSPNLHWKKAVVKTPIYAKDWLWVKKNIRVYFTVEDKDLKGEFVFLSDSINNPDKDDAMYEFNSRPKKLNLFVTQGTVLVNWFKGFLDINSRNSKTSVVNTEVIVIVDSTSEKTFVFVKKGKIQLTQKFSKRMSSSDAALIGKNESPRVYAPELPIVIELNRFYDHTFKLKSLVNPWYLRHSKIVLAGSSVPIGGLVYYWATRGSDKPELKPLPAPPSLPTLP